MSTTWIKFAPARLTDWQIFTNNGQFNNPLPPSRRFKHRCLYFSADTDVEEFRQRCRSARSRCRSATTTSIQRVRSARRVT